ncbi:hypothetical protein AGDE_13057 [Angomonas deanei]|uniref:Uncharacterized protein n=1 Tax=Angomonas deanei TaxID=59799 RepID=A0A7G2CCC7_9TRYP|nr:hypothetical protein AGDE_13057 [Angomonas deanei]CAD2215732.1 hypothetical protein, conserved [Angomonas deanei]|eukprot:EPY23095.1 hypothetical protein AGDE_13057 [Angomonas deanei]
MSPSAELSSLSSIPDTRRKSESSHKDYFSDKESNAASTGTRSKYAPLDDYREKKRAEAQSALSALRERRAQAEKEQSLVDLVEVEAPPSVTSLRSVPLRPSTRWEDYVKEAEREARRGSTTPRSSGGKVPSRREGSFEDIPYPSSVSALNRYYHDRKRETVPAPVYVADDPQDDPPPKHYFDQPAENTREHTPTRPVEKVAHREPSVHDTKRPSPSPAEENKYNNNNNRNNGEKIVSDPLVCKNFAQKINQMSSALEFFYSN